MFCVHLRRDCNLLFLDGMSYTINYIYIVYIWSTVSFKVIVSLLIFCLDDLLIDVSGVIKIYYYYCISFNFSFYVY